MNDANSLHLPLTLSPDVQDAVRRHLASGRFTDVGHVLLAAVFALEDAMRIEDEVVSGFAPGELAALIEAGERSGMQDGPTALAEFESWRQAQVAAQGGLVTADRS